MELKNRFKILENNPDDLYTQGKWDIIKATYVETAANNLGYRTKKNKEWLTSDRRKKETKAKNPKY